MRLLILDVLLTGLSILLEFAALVALRIREPNLERPYRVPGGTLGAILIGLPPLALIVTALVRNSKESVGSTNELVIGSRSRGRRHRHVFSHPHLSAQEGSLISRHAE